MASMMLGAVGGVDLVVEVVGLDQENVLSTPLA
jgi:hypothetical protein